MPKHALQHHPLDHPNIHPEEALVLDQIPVPEDVGRVLRSMEESQRSTQFAGLVNSLWKVIGVLGVLLLLAVLAGWYSGTQSQNAVEEVKENRTLSFEKGAVDCTASIADLVDGDASAFVPQAYCFKREVIAYYHDDVCAIIKLDKEDGCGSAVP
jgi:hypothetical protein